LVVPLLFLRFVSVIWM